MLVQSSTLRPTNFLFLGILYLFTASADAADNEHARKLTLALDRALAYVRIFLIAQRRPTPNHSTAKAR